MYGPGLRYELATDVYGGFIVWCNGGFPCGLYPDISLAREAFVHGLFANERAVADNGYADEHYFVWPNLFPPNDPMHRLLKQIMTLLMQD